MANFHEKLGSGHPLGNATTHKILRAGYYWPTLFKDAHTHVRTYHQCQTFYKRENHVAIPLQPIIEVWSFSQWVLDFIRVINPNSSQQHKFMLIDTNYYTRWDEAIVIKLVVVIKFLETNIVIRFITPFSLVCDNGLAFQSTDFTEWAYDNHITLKFSSNYYP